MKKFLLSGALVFFVITPCLYSEPGAIQVKIINATKSAIISVYSDENSGWLTGTWNQPILPHAYALNKAHPIVNTCKSGENVNHYIEGFTAVDLGHFIEFTIDNQLSCDGQLITQRVTFLQDHPVCTVQKAGVDATKQYNVVIQCKTFNTSST